MMDMIEAIKQVQQNRQLTDAGLAGLLGVSQATISFVKSGKRQAGAKVLRALARELPELQPYVLGYMSDGDNA